jgi:hypothetical protein
VLHRRSGAPYADPRTALAVSSHRWQLLGDMSATAPLLVAIAAIANTINIGADIGAMAAAAQLLVPCHLLSSPSCLQRSS